MNEITYNGQSTEASVGLRDTNAHERSALCIVVHDNDA